MTSVYSVLFTLVLFSELSSHVATAGAIERDGLGSLLGDQPMTEHATVPLTYRRRLVMNDNRDDDGNPKIIVGSDMRLKGRSLRGLNPTFSQSLPPLTDQSLSYTPAEYSLKVDRRNTDLDILRCMIGRVYRPCWEVV
ncbi:pro-MCH [Echeneis naucrates]|uniref:pro-MCH n=1 Tax=Echeneis naucrates TaxID=173247 RepID=UPI0011135511|nr:pro-MCH 2-like [Echeneis naucrates]